MASYNGNTTLEESNIEGEPILSLEQDSDQGLNSPEESESHSSDFRWLDDVSSDDQEIEDSPIIP